MKPRLDQISRNIESYVLERKIYYGKTPSRENRKVLFDIETDKEKRLIGYSLATHPVAYVGTKHPLLQNVGYEFLYFMEQPHGGFTFSEKGDDSYLPAGWYYFGWDYSHFGDWVNSYSIGRKYTSEEILIEAVNVARNLELLEYFLDTVVTERRK